MLNAFRMMRSVYRAQRAISRHDHESARVHLDVALAIQPNNGLANFLRGVACYELLEHEDAYAHFSKSLAANPNDANTFALRALTAMRLDDIERARADLRHAAAIGERTILTQLALATLRLQSGDYDAGLCHLRNVEALAPKAKEHKAATGIALFLKGDHLQARDSLRRAFAAGFTDAYAALILHCAETRLGGNARSELECAAAALSAGRWPRPVIEWLMERATAEDMLADASTDRERAEAHFYIGHCHLVAGRCDDATHHLKMAAASPLFMLTEREAARAELARLGIAA
ncbi:MAG: hypothetical protein R3D27_04135 [Hyphomicrobiaceae bacterium]